MKNFLFQRIAKMKTPVLIGISTAIIWILIRYLAYALGFFTFGNPKMFVFLNMFLLTSAVSIGLFIIKKNQQEDTNLLLDIKTGMTAAMPHTVIVSCFLFLFYSYIQPEYNQHQIEQTRKSLMDKTFLSELRKSNPALENKTDQELLNEGVNQTRQWTSPKFTMIVSLLALLMYSTFNSIIIALIYRGVVFKPISK